MGALETWSLGGQEDCRRCSWGKASRQWRSSLQRTLHTHLCTWRRGGRGQETTTFHRGQSHCLGDMEIAWEGLLLDYCQYCGVPYRQNKSHEDPNSVWKLLLKLWPSEHSQSVSEKRKSKSIQTFSSSWSSDSHYLPWLPGLPVRPPAFTRAYFPRLTWICDLVP